MFLLYLSISPPLYLSVSPSLCLSVSLFLCLSISQSVHLCISLHSQCQIIHHTYYSSNNALRNVAHVDDTECSGCHFHRQCERQGVNEGRRYAKLVEGSVIQEIWLALMIQ